MQLKSLQNFFQNGLIGYYPKEEINAFFYRICEQHLNYKRIDVSLKGWQHGQPRICRSCVLYVWASYNCSGTHFSKRTDDWRAMDRMRHRLWRYWISRALRSACAR